MSVRVNNIKLSLDDDMVEVKKIAAKMARVKEADMENFKIIRESIDARKKSNIEFVYSVQFNCQREMQVVTKSRNKDVKLEEEASIFNIKPGSEALNNPVVIVGCGPAGMFAGLTLAKWGYTPIIIERGDRVDKRTAKIDKFFKDGLLDTDSNIQFGEGGAGTFSDGKLTTRIKDARCDIVLEEFVKSGAKDEIIYSGKPHIGTDILKKVVENMRNEIISLGGEVRFNSRVTDIIVNGDKIEGIRVNDEYEIPTSTVIFAIGHSSRDTYEMLLKRGLEINQKPFAIGVRIEHLQSMIDESQFGKFAGHPRLKSADYRLTYTSEGFKRPCYSFCMCPGGYVVAAASENERLVTNGMSEYKRDGKNANSAIVVGVGPDDFSGSHPLAGLEFQRMYEALAYKTGGGSYKAPVQLVGDFLKDNVSKSIGRVNPTYTRGYIFEDLKKCLPSYVIGVLREGLLDFDKRIRGFADNDAVMTGIETRTSAPVRLERNEALESTRIKGLYPCGEGAGYAGGIVSAAVDGIKVAEKIIQKYAPLK